MRRQRTRPCMRMLALATLCVSTVASPAVAQFGFRGGMNLSKFVGADAARSESARGLNLGASIALFHIGPVSIVPEVYYAEKGSKELDLATATTFEYGLDYTIPGLGGLNLDARLVRGLARLKPGSTGSDIKNQAASLMLGYYIGR